MKHELNKLLEIIIDYTEINIDALRCKTNQHAIVEARHLFTLTALKHGDYRNLSDITDTVGLSDSSIQYIKTQKYHYSRDLREIDQILDKMRSDNVVQLKNAVKEMDWKTRYDLANEILNTIPKHKFVSFSL
jgi:hypothetical protein